MTAGRGGMRHINLYQAEFRPTRAVLPAARLLAVLALFLAGLGAVAGWELWQARRLAAQLPALERQAVALEERLAKASKRPAADPAVLAEIASLETRLAALGRAEQALRDGSVGASQGWAAIFEALARVTAPGLWLTGVELDGQPGHMTLTGRALDGAAPAAYITRLRAEPRFAGLAFSALEITEPAEEDDSRGGRPPAFLEFRLSGPTKPADAAQTPRKAAQP